MLAVQRSHFASDLVPSPGSYAHAALEVEQRGFAVILLQRLVRF